MNYTTILEDFAFTFDNYLELGVSGYDYEVEAYKKFCDEFEDYFTDMDHDLCAKIFGLIEIAGEHFDFVAAQEELEQEIDERKYAGMHHLS